MHLVYYNGSGTHGISTLISVIVVFGSFVGCLVGLYAFGLRARVRHLELELARLHPRSAGVADPPAV